MSYQSSGLLQNQGLKSWLLMFTVVNWGLVIAFVNIVDWEPGYCTVHRGKQLWKEKMSVLGREYLHGLGSAIENADGNVEILLSFEKEGIVHDSTKSLSKK